MLNLFAEVKNTNNKLSPQAAVNVTAVYARLMSLDYFHFPAAAMMDIAHDLHAHGSALENEFAEQIVAGVAEGLAIQEKVEKRYPRCPNCGRRHPR